MKHFIFFILLFVGFENSLLLSQDTLKYKYFVGHSYPSSNWKDKSFNDSTWIDGKGPLGYGYNEVNVVTDTTVSVYLRHTFIIHKGHLRAFVLYADYDDGFIAYINGIEVIRANMPNNTSEPTNTTTTIRSRKVKFSKMPFYVIESNLGFYVDSLILDNCINDSINVLSIEVHNDSIKGTDLYFGFKYSFVDTRTDTLFSWNYSIAKPKSDSTQLPIVIIETNEFGLDTTSIIANMKIINNPADAFNKPSDRGTDYDGKIRVKLHGTSSLGSPKQSLRIELKDSLGNSKNISLLGLPKENDFILYAPFRDRTLIKNDFTYNLGRRMGYYEPRTKYCDFILNGRNMGTYVLTEKIKVDKNRVNIEKIKPEDNDGENLTGGYILVRNSQLEVDWPSPEKITSAQKEYILKYYADFEETLLSSNLMDPENGIRKYIDINSFVDYWIISELSKNFDAFSRSYYMTKNRNGKLKFGLLWDYDVAWYYNDDQNFVNWQFDWSGHYSKINYFLYDSLLMKQFKDTWHLYRKNFLSNDSLLWAIDKQVEIHKSAIDRNYEIWPIIEYSYFSKNRHETYQDKIDTMKTWTLNRAKWIDENIESLGYKLIVEKIHNANFQLKKLNCFPNPFNDRLYVKFESDEPGDIIIELCDLFDRVCFVDQQRSITKGETELTIVLPNNLRNGMYFLKIMKDNICIATSVVIKE